MRILCGSAWLLGWVMFCNHTIVVNERIADMIFSPEFVDRIKSSHYALVFGDIHLLQDEPYIHIVC